MSAGPLRVGMAAQEPAPLPPGPRGWPLVGDTRSFARDRLGYVTGLAREYGDVVRAQMAGGMDIYALFHPDHVRHVLVDNNANYRKGALFQRQLGFLGSGVLNAEGEAWRHQRHAVEPAFHPERIEQYAGFMTEYAERTVASWGDDEVRDVHADMMRLTLEVVAKALFDVDLRTEEAAVGEALGTIMAATRRRTARLVPLPDWVPTPEGRALDRTERRLDAVVEDIIAARRDAGDAGDVVSALLRGGPEGDGMTERAVRDEVLTLLLAGHETTAQALTYTWHLLARHPRVEDRLLEEFDNVLDDDPPTVDDVEDLAYTERVVRESMRLYPPVWGLLREPVEDDVIGGYRLPAGATVGLYQWVIHRDPRFYDDPLAFRPERWTDAFRSSLHPFAYFPFSGGPRRCLGDRFALLEAQLIVATILRRYHLEAVPGEDLDLAPSITLRPADGLRMRVRRRD